MVTRQLATIGEPLTCGFPRRQVANRPLTCADYKVGQKHTYMREEELQEHGRT